MKETSKNFLKKAVESKKARPGLRGPRGSRDAGAIVARPHAVQPLEPLTSMTPSTPLPASSVLLPGRETAVT